MCTYAYTMPYVHTSSLYVHTYIHTLHNTHVLWQDPLHRQWRLNVTSDDVRMCDRRWAILTPMWRASDRSRGAVNRQCLQRSHITQGESYRRWRFRFLSGQKNGNRPTAAKGIWFVIALGYQIHCQHSWKKVSTFVIQIVTSLGSYVYITWTHIHTTAVKGLGGGWNINILFSQWLQWNLCNPTPL